VPGGQTEVAQFTVTVSDGTATYTDTNTAVTITSTAPTNMAPELSGLASSQTVSDRSTIQLFSGTSYADPDAGQTMTLTVALDKSTRGSFTTLAGFVDGGNGTYTFTGSAAATQEALHGLVFTPIQYQGMPGETITAKLTITYTDGVAPIQTSVAYLGIQVENTAPALAGATASSIDDIRTLKPFATMTVADPDKGAVETVTVQLDDPAKGVFTTLGGFTDNGNGTYSFTGSPAAVQSALRAMVFDPTDGRVPGGQTETTRFTVTISDGSTTYTDTNTAVTIISTAQVNTAPALSGLSISQTMERPGTLRPFASTFYTDPDAGQMATVRVTIDKTLLGSFTTLAGFTDEGGGAYSFVGTASAAQDAMRGLTFTPGQYAATPGVRNATTLTISYTDGLASTQTSRVDLGIVALNTAPALAGATASSIDDIRTLKPFATMTVADPDKGAVETVTVQLDDPAKGVFTTLGGFTDNGNGTYSFTGSPAAVQSALRAMVFDPTDGRVPRGQSEYSQFIVTASDGMAAAFDDRTTILVFGTVSQTQPLFASSLTG
jgi:ethanolamine utilization microcompartment shell protein EutS